MQIFKCEEDVNHKNIFTKNKLVVSDFCRAMYNLVEHNVMLPQQREIPLLYSHEQFCKADYNFVNSLHCDHSCQNVFYDQSYADSVG